MTSRIKVKITIDDVVDNVLDYLNGLIPELVKERFVDVDGDIEFVKDLHPLLGAGFSAKNVKNPVDGAPSVMWIDADKAIDQWIMALMEDSIQ